MCSLGARDVSWVSTKRYLMWHSLVPFRDRIKKAFFLLPCHFTCHVSFFPSCSLSPSANNQGQREELVLDTPRCWPRWVFGGLWEKPGSTAENNVHCIKKSSFLSLKFSFESAKCPAGDKRERVKHPTSSNPSSSYVARLCYQSKHCPGFENLHKHRCALGTVGSLSQEKLKGGLEWCLVL